METAVKSMGGGENMRTHFQEVLHHAGIFQSQITTKGELHVSHRVNESSRSANFSRFNRASIDPSSESLLRYLICVAIPVSNTKLSSSEYLLIVSLYSNRRFRIQLYQSLPNEF